jgi:hypothetical protein
MATGRQLSWISGGCGYDMSVEQSSRRHTAAAASTTS